MRELGYTSADSHQSLVELLEGGAQLPAVLACLSGVPGYPEKAVNQRTSRVVVGGAGMHRKGECQGDVGGALTRPAARVAQKVK